VGACRRSPPGAPRVVFLRHPVPARLRSLHPSPRRSATIATTAGVLPSAVLRSYRLNLNGKKRPWIPDAALHFGFDGQIRHAARGNPPFAPGATQPPEPPPHAPERRSCPLYRSFDALFAFCCAYSPNNWSITSRTSSPRAEFPAPQPELVSWPLARMYSYIPLNALESALLSENTTVYTAMSLPSTPLATGPRLGGA